MDAMLYSQEMTQARLSAERQLKVNCHANLASRLHGLSHENASEWPGLRSIPTCIKKVY